MWDIGGNPYLRKTWKLYFKNIPTMAIIYVVNVSEDVERLRESKEVFKMLINEPVLQDCIVALVFNVKPLKKSLQV